MASEDVFYVSTQVHFIQHSFSRKATEQEGSQNQDGTLETDFPCGILSVPKDTNMSY